MAEEAFEVFQRYNGKARRVIFFARYEVSQFGASAIATEHLLLGLAREDKALIRRFVPEALTLDELRKQIEVYTEIGQKIPTTVEIPLSEESQRVLKYTAEEADLLSHKRITTAHLLLGLLRAKGSLAERVLQDNGATLEGTRQALFGSE